MACDEPHTATFGDGLEPDEVGASLFTFGASQPVFRLPTH